LQSERRNQILVDEATDFSPIQLASMRTLADQRTGSFFLSGDFNQRLSEIDRAVRENRLMEYRIKKAWADSWSRTLSIAVALIFAIFAGFVIYWDLLRA
jgi:DNA helicase IV